MGSWGINDVKLQGYLAFFQVLAWYVLQKVGSVVGGTSAGILDKHHQHGDPQLTSVNPEVMALVEPQDHAILALLR